ncbi:MAG: class I SAM-dependent methyltransferase [Verrucomicrobium sp.]
MSNAAENQTQYYERTAAEYDALHLEESEHEFALAQLMGLVRYFKFDSLLDVGAGTGRVIRHTRDELPTVRIAGVEPVAGLREIAYSKGISPEQLKDGNALKLDFADNSWDVVCAFGILHHIPQPELAIAEMCRVARYGVFFSDLNNYGCGSLFQRTFAQTLRSLGLWRPFQFFKNGGRYEKYSEGDGIHYSYSLFDSLPTIRRKFKQTHLTNTKGHSENLYSGCSHISVFAVADSIMLENRRKELGR